MPKLELPIRAFVDDFMQRAFPNRDWSRGSAVRDLLIQPMSAVLQPLRHEIDLLKIGQSVTNYEFMRREDLDALAANWGQFRQSGGRSVGNVRLFFDRAANYEFQFLEFVADDGTVFVLRNPVRITAAELIANRRSDNTFFFDVPVQSVGTGGRYALSAGSINVLRNGPESIVRVTNVEDFAVTAPDQSNLDVVNALYRNLGLRNLVSRSSIRAPLLETFPGILDIFIAGSTHPKMVRDLITTEINGVNVELHLGGMVDVWLNTSGVVQREVTLSYLPSTKQVQIVSAEQAGEGSLLYAFSRILLDTEGNFAAAEFGDTNLDESVAVYIDQAGVPVEGSVIDVRRNDMFRLSARDLISGDDMISLPVPGNGSGAEEFLLTDVFGRNLANTDVQAGDVLRKADDYFRVLRRDGRVLKVSPDLDTEASLSFDDNSGATPVNAGDRFIPLTAAAGQVEVNDRLIITRGGAQGHYRVLAVDGTGIWVGRIEAEMQLEYVSDDGLEFTYNVLEPGVAVAGEIPSTVDETFWVYLSNDGAYDQTGSQWLRVVSVTRSATGVQIVTAGGSASNYPNTTLVAGLSNALADGTLLLFRRPSGSDFAQSVLQDYDTGHTLYANVLDETLTAGTNTLTAAGVGNVGSFVGSLIMFDPPGTLSEAETADSGGDGTKYTVFVSKRVNPDEVEFLPALPADIPAGTRYSILRNADPIATATADSISGSKMTVNSWPLGVGDALGMGISLADDVASFSIATETHDGGSTRLTMHPGATGLSEIRAGDAISIASTGGPASLDGNHQVLDVDVANQLLWLVGQPGPGTDVWAAGEAIADVQCQRIYVVESSTAGDVRTLSFQPPQQARTLTFSATDYVAPSAADIGAAVKQTVGGTTYAAVLDSFDNTARTWTVIPNDPSSDVFALWTGAGEEVTILNSAATGRPTSTGTLFDITYFEPAPTDIGKIVRQGSYVGVLDGFTGAPTYEWSVKPLSQFDLFDRTDVLTFVDRNGTGSPLVDDAQGYLRIPASAPEVNGGMVTVTLDRPISFTPGSTVNIRSRFGVYGGFFDGNRFRVYADPAINNTPFGGVTAGEERLVVLNGTNFDLYDVSDVDDYFLETSSGAPISDPVRIANAPAQQQLPIAAPITAGSTTIAAPGSRLGLWGHAGRILRLVVGGTTFNLTISGPNAVDSVTLLDPLPISIYPSQNIQYEIVEAFHLPYFLLGTKDSYRIFRAPDAGDVIAQGSTGSHSTVPAVQDQFTDSSVNFLALFGFSDFDLPQQDLLLYIDSGPEASVDPYPIVGIVGENTLVLDHVFTNTNSSISYHVVRKNRAPEHEQWFYAKVLSANTLQLQVDSSFDFDRFHTYRSWQAVMRPSPGSDVRSLPGPWSIPPVTVSDYDPSTQILTLDVASDHVAEATEAGIWDSSSGAGQRGFQDPTFQYWVRLTFRALDRVTATDVAGSAISTFNYYSSDFFALPIVRIQKVEQLDSETLQPVKVLPYSLQVDDAGLRYSHEETNRLVVTEPGNDVIFQPIRVTYVADTSIEAIDAYLNADDTAVLSSNVKAKRMETISVSVTISLRSEQTEAALQNLIASYINNLDSTQRMSKDGLIRFLYQEDAVSFIDTDSLVLNAEYHKLDGDVDTFNDVSEVFGADTAGYLANILSVNKITGL